MIVLDASVLIAQFEASDAHHDRAAELLVDAADETLVVSPLTLAEVLVGPARSGRLDAAQAAVDTLGVDLASLSPDAPRRLAALRAETRLRLPDCWVLLAAISAKAAVATFDERLAAAASELGLTVRQ